MKLGLKIILPILLLLVIILGSFGYLLYNLKQQEAIISTETLRIQKLNSLNERLARQEDQTEDNVLAYRFNPDRSFLLAISQAQLDKSKTLDEMFPFITTSHGRELVSGYINSRKEIESLRNQLIKAIDGGDKEQISLSYNKWRLQTQNIKAALSDIKAYNINSLEKTLATVGDIRNKIFEIIIILVFVVVAMVLFLYFYLRIVITAPIIKLASFAQEVANKNFTTTTTTRKDEIGMLSRAFNTMVDKLKASYTTLEQKVTDRTVNLAEKTQEAENSRKAILNVLEDLNSERSKLQIAKVKDEAMLSSIGDGVIATDQDGMITVINKAAENILGFTSAEMLGKLFTQDAQVLQAINLAISSGKTTIANTFQFICKDGSKVPVALTVAPVIINSKTIGAILVFRDITKEKEIDRTKSEFVSLASHQLRTPLGIIKWYLEALQNDNYFKNAPSDTRKYFDEIYSSNERVLSLVRDLLSVSRIDQGKVKNVPKPIFLAETLQEIIDQMQIVARNKKVRLRLIIKDSELPPITIDLLRFREAIENLITNALEYSLPGSLVEVTLTKNNDTLLISVKDTGLGISKADLKLLFTKFFRSDEAVKHNPEGSGLGLYVVKSYVESWGGKLAVQSEHGKGSTFTIGLPIK